MWNTQYFQNVKQSTQKLISHIDTYKTLKQFLYFNKYKKLLEDPNDAQVRKCREYFSKSDHKIRSLRGVSHFENVELIRTCRETMVPFVYCRCTQFLDLTKNEKEFIKDAGLTFKEATWLIIDKINSMTDDCRDKCEPFKFKSIKSVNEIVYNDERIYKIKFLTTPGEAEFIATVRINSSKSIELFNKIIRSSIYGKQSECMSKAELYGFCFCK
jgi:hypothetical protein